MVGVVIVEDVEVCAGVEGSVVLDCSLVESAVLEASVLESAVLEAAVVESVVESVVLGSAVLDSAVLDESSVLLVLEGSFVLDGGIVVLVSC